MRTTTAAVLVLMLGCAAVPVAAGTVDLVLGRSVGQVRKAVKAMDYKAALESQNVDTEALPPGLAKVLRAETDAAAEITSLGTNPDVGSVLGAVPNGPVSLTVSVQGNPGCSTFEGCAAVAQSVSAFLGSDEVRGARSVEGVCQFRVAKGDTELFGRAVCN